MNTRNWAFHFIPVVLPILVLELGLRLYDAARGADTHARAYWFWAFEQDRFLGYRARPNLRMRLASGGMLDTNSDGFRDHEVPVTSLERRRLIVCVGESSTWGTGAADRMRTWPRFLQHELRQLGPEPFLTLNAGIPGYSTLENLQLVNLRLLKWNPEILLYMGFRNDWYNYASYLDIRSDVNSFPRALAPLPNVWPYRLLLRSSLAAFVASRMGTRWSFDAPEPPSRPSLLREGVTSRGETTFRTQIALLASLARRHGVRLIWVDQPIDYTYVDGPSRVGLERMRAVLREELARLHVPLLEAHTQYDFARFPLVDDVHFTEHGNQELSRILAPQLLDVLGVR